jgi:hypothetical protein
MHLKVANSYGTHKAETVSHCLKKKRILAKINFKKAAGMVN